MSNEKKLDFAKIFEESRNEPILANKIAALEILKKQFEKQYPNITAKVPNPKLRIYKVTFELYCDISLTLIQALDENQQNAQVLNHANQVLQSIYRLATIYSPENYKQINQILGAHPKDCPDLALSLASILSLLAKAYSNTKKHDKALECFNNALELIKCRFGDVLSQDSNALLEKNKLLRDIFNNIQLAKADFLCTFECYQALPQGETRRAASDIYLQLIKWVNSSSEPYSAEELALMQYNISVNIRKEALELSRSKHDNKLIADKFKEAAGFNIAVILADRDIRGDNACTLDDDSFVLAEDFNKNLVDASELQSGPVVKSVPESKSDSIKWRLFIAYIATREQLDVLKNIPSFNEFLNKNLVYRLQNLRVTAEQQGKLAEIAKLPIFAVTEKSPAQMAAPIFLTPSVQVLTLTPIPQSMRILSPAPGRQAEQVLSPPLAQVPAAASASTPVATPTGDTVVRKRKVFQFVTDTPAVVSTPAVIAPAPAVKEPVRQEANLPQAAYKVRDQETFVIKQDESIKAKVVIKDWNELDDEIYAAARSFNAAFKSLSSYTQKYQFVDAEGCLIHKVLIVPPAELSQAEKLAYGKRILERLKTVYGITRNTHLEDASARKNERYNEYFTKGKTGEAKPKKIGNILSNNAVEGTVAIYGSTASLVAAIVVKNRPGFKPLSDVSEIVSDKVEVAASPVKASAPLPAPEKKRAKFIAANNEDEPDLALHESAKPAVESKQSASESAPKKKKSGPDQKTIDRRAAAFFVPTFKATFRAIKEMDVYEQIGAVNSLTEMYIQAVVDNGAKKINYHVTNIYVAALILRIDAYMVLQQYNDVLQECQSLKTEFSTHGKYKEEAGRLEGLCKLCNNMLNPQGVQHDEPLQQPMHVDPVQEPQNAEASLPASPKPHLEPWTPNGVKNSSDEAGHLTDEEVELDHTKIETKKRASVEDLLQAAEKPVASPELKKRAVVAEQLQEDLSRYPATYKFFKTPSPPREPAVQAPAPISGENRLSAKKSIPRAKVPSTPSASKKPAPRKRGEATDQMRLLSTVPGKKAKEDHQEEPSNNNAPK